MTYDLPRKGSKVRSNDHRRRHTGVKRTAAPAARQDAESLHAVLHRIRRGPAAGASPDALLRSGVLGNQALARLVVRPGAPLPAAIQRNDFRDRAIAKIKKYAEDENESLDCETCGDAARLIYNAVSLGQQQAGSGTGVASLVSAITKAEQRVDQVFIYLVDADIVGHFFTILQYRDQATIMQGYLEKISVAKDIAEDGGGRTMRDTATLKKDLADLVALRDKVKDIVDWRDADEPNLVALGKVHTRLFGPGTDAEERLWIKKNIIRKRGADLSWKASFAEGQGPALDAPPPRKCFLTTACTSYLGLPDDCEELTVLRAFRDGYMLDSPGGVDQVAAYYRVAPAIVDAVDALPASDAAAVWRAMYGEIRSCVDSITAGDEASALRTYGSAVAGLADRLLEPAYPTVMGCPVSKRVLRPETMKGKPLVYSR